MSRPLFLILSSAYAVTALTCMASVVLAVTVPIVFHIDNTQSEIDLEVTVKYSFLGDSDSDSSSISGVAMANLSIDTSSGTPLVESMDFAGPVTGNRFVVDETMAFHFSFGFFGSVDATGTGLAGYVGTPAPPAPVASQDADDLSYTFDGRYHQYMLNEGILAYSGLASGEMDLSTNPAGGIPPAGTMGTLNLTQGDTNGNLTDFIAVIDMPIQFTDSTTDEETGLTVTWDANGRVVGSGSFSVDLGLGGTPGDFDSDGDVDGNDFLLWQGGYGTTYDAADLASWQENFGSMGAATGEATAVPEPAMGWMLAVAIGLALCRARR